MKREQITTYIALYVTQTNTLEQHTEITLPLSTCILSFSIVLLFVFFGLASMMTKKNKTALMTKKQRMCHHLTLSLMLFRFPTRTGLWNYTVFLFTAAQPIWDTVSINVVGMLSSLILRRATNPILFAYFIKFSVASDKSALYHW